MTRIVRFHSIGGAEVLQIDDIDVGAPGPGEVRMRVRTLGLNRAESMFRRGIYPEVPVLPAKLGYEAPARWKRSATGWKALLPATS